MNLAADAVETHDGPALQRAGLCVWTPHPDAMHFVPGAGVIGIAEVLADDAVNFDSLAAGVAGEALRRCQCEFAAEAVLCHAESDDPDGRVVGVFGEDALEAAE